jgi:Ca-activated chloride channel family protein
MKLTVMALLCAAGLTSGPAAPAPAPDRDGRDLVAAAQQAMTDGRFDEALDLYGKAGELLPLRAEIPYNMGVAAYRLGDLARAAELFDQARLLTSDPSMQARSAYNLGTTAARSALDSQEQDAAIAKTQMQDATDSLKSSLDHFRQAIEADPGDVDARANGELAWRWLQQLEEQMEQQGQQQQDSGQDPDENSDENSDENQDQQQPPQDNQDQGESQDQQQQDQPQPSPDEGDEQEEQQGDQGEQQEQEEQQSTAQQQEQSQQDERPDTSERKPMTLEEADRLLQNVRDKEARRREELARQEASRRRPVDKDW